MIMEIETDVDGNGDGMYLYVDVLESEYVQYSLFNIVCRALWCCCRNG